MSFAAALGAKLLIIADAVFSWVPLLAEQRASAKGVPASPPQGIAEEHHKGLQEDIQQLKRRVKPQQVVYGVPCSRDLQWLWLQPPPFLDVAALCRTAAC